MDQPLRNPGGRWSITGMTPTVGRKAALLAGIGAVGVVIAAVAVKEIQREAADAGEAR